MPDGPDITQDPQQTPAPPPPSTQDMPLAPRPGAPAAPAPSGPPPTPPPSPQAQQAAKHQLVGKFVSEFMGGSTDYKMDPTTGETVAVPQRNTPGQWGRSMVLGAMLGLASQSKTEARGGALGGFMGGLGLGGTAVAEHGEQQDQQKMQRAQEQYKNQMQAQQNQREQNEEGRRQEGFKTEETLKQATIAQSNLAQIKLQQAIKGGSLDDVKAIVQVGQSQAEPYKLAGVEPQAHDLTQAEGQKILAANPKAIGWQMFPTGWKSVMSADGKESTWVPTFDIYDTSRTVPMTTKLIDQMEKAGVDDAAPGTIKRLREMQANGKEFSPIEYASLMKLYTNAYTDQYNKKKNNLSLEDTRAQINERNAKATEDLRLHAAAMKDQAFGEALGAWDQKWAELKKTNPEATQEDAFNALGEGKTAAERKKGAEYKGSLLTGIAKWIPELDKTIHDNLDPLHFNQAAADEAYALREHYRQIQSQILGATTKKTTPTTGAQPETVKDVVQGVTGRTTQYNPDTLKNEPTKKLTGIDAYRAIDGRNMSPTDKIEAMKQAKATVPYEVAAEVSRKTAKPIDQVIANYKALGLEVQTESQSRADTYPAMAF